jgi:hypothetical protein
MITGIRILIHHIMVDIMADIIVRVTTCVVTIITDDTESSAAIEISDAAGDDPLADRAVLAVVPPAAALAAVAVLDTASRMVRAWFWTLLGLRTALLCPRYCQHWGRWSA